MSARINDFRQRADDENVIIAIGEIDAIILLVRYYDRYYAALNRAARLSTHFAVSPRRIAKRAVDMIMSARFSSQIGVGVLSLMALTCWLKICRISLQR